MDFHEIDISSIDFNPFEKIGKDWFLLTAGTKDDFNTMTASWGGMGVIWHKNVFTTVVRPSRHTYQKMENNSLFTISFFSDDYRDVLDFCGSHSGRDCDKAKATGITPLFIDGAVGFEQAEMVLVCKKLYRNSLDEDNFTDLKTLDDYNAKGEAFHVAYIGEILKAYQKN
ncbi:MAG: flavin reductase [Oscillospiraceae bacterium]